MSINKAFLPDKRNQSELSSSSKDDLRYPDSPQERDLESSYHARNFELAQSPKDPNSEVSKDMRGKTKFQRAVTKIKNVFSFSSKHSENNDYILEQDKKRVSVSIEDFNESFKIEKEDIEEKKTKVDSDHPITTFQKQFAWKRRFRYILYSSVSIGIVLLMLILYFASVEKKGEESFVKVLTKDTNFIINLSFCKLKIHETPHTMVSYKFRNKCWSCSDTFDFKGDLAQISVKASADTLQFCNLDLFIPSGIKFSSLNVQCSNECYVVIDSVNLQSSQTSIIGDIVYANIRSIETVNFTFFSKFGDLLINEIYLDQNANITILYGNVIVQSSKSDLNVTWHNTRKTYCLAGPFTKAIQLPDPIICHNNGNSSGKFFRIFSIAVF